MKPAFFLSMHTNAWSPFKRRLLSCWKLSRFRRIVFGLSSSQDRYVSSQIESRIDSTVRIFLKISRGSERWYQWSPSCDETSRRRIRQLISRPSIAHVAEFISRSYHCYRSIAEISSQPFSLSCFPSLPSSRCNSVQFSKF